METQTLEEEIAEAKKRLKKVEAEYDAVKERNPDAPRLDWLLQDKIAATQLLNNLYVKERLHLEQQARETPAGNVRFLYRVILWCIQWQEGMTCCSPPSTTLTASFHLSVFRCHATL